MFISPIVRGLATASASFVFLAGIAFVPAAAQSREMPMSANKQALAFFEQARVKADNLEDPGTLFDQAVQKDPGFAFGYLFAGQTNVEFQNNLEKAVSLAAKATPAEREWIMSIEAQNRGDQDAALTHLQAVEKLYPHDKRVLMQMGNYYRGIGDDAKSLEYYLAASKVDKKYAPPYNIIGYSYVALGNFGEAEKAFKTYISLIPNNANPYDSYGEMLLNSGKFDESIRQYSMALAKNPSFYNSYEGMGNAYEYKGDFAKAREMYQMMFDRSQTEALKAQALASMSNSWISEGRFAEALKVNERRIETARKAGDGQTQFGLHNLGALIATESGDFETAAKEIDMAAALAVDPSLPAATAPNRAFNLGLARARLMIAKNDTAGAKAQLEWLASAAKNLNQNRNYNLVAGYSELKQGRAAAASEFFAKANQADPFVWYNQAQALEAQNDSAGAQRLYKKIATLNQLDTTGYALVRSRAVAKLK